MLESATYIILFKKSKTLTSDKKVMYKMAKIVKVITFSDFILNNFNQILKKSKRNESMRKHTKKMFFSNNILVQHNFFYVFVL